MLLKNAGNYKYLVLKKIGYECINATPELGFQVSTNNRYYFRPKSVQPKAKVILYLRMVPLK